MTEQNNNTENNVTTETVRERLNRTLSERAAAITSVRNDVYTTKFWQLAINFVLAAGAVTLMIVGMIVNGLTATLTALFGIILVVGVLIFNIVLRRICPSSFLQYTCFQDGKRYCIRILGKERATFSDGENSIEVNRTEYGKTNGTYLSEYKFDFFADMDADMRIGKPDSEIFKGHIELGGKRRKCKIVFKNGLPYVGTVAGARIKYFDVNEQKEKFVVPAMLKDAAKKLDVIFPKLPGVHVREGMRDPTKQ